MADETTTETQAEETTATTLTETTPPPETPPAETLAESPAEAAPEPTVAEKAKKWDAERQKRDEAKAAEFKALKEATEAQAAKQTALENEIAELKKAKTPPPPTPPTADELQAMADEAEALNDPENAKYDPDAGRKIESKLRKATLERQKILDTRLKAREEQDAQASAKAQWWAQWRTKNPECDETKAQAIVEAGFTKFKDRYQGDALGARVVEELESRMDEVKKAKSPPVRTPAAPKTASSASVSAPAGVQVVPANSGARQTPMQMKDATTILAKAMKALRGG